MGTPGCLSAAGQMTDIDLLSAFEEVAKLAERDGCFS